MWRHDVAAQAEIAGARAAHAPRASGATARRAEAKMEETMAVGRVPEEGADLVATALCVPTTRHRYLVRGAHASVFGRGLFDRVHRLFKGRVFWFQGGFDRRI